MQRTPRAGKEHSCSGYIASETYPQNKISRTNTYRSHFVATHSVGTNTEIQMRALVGRRIQASAANISDRRNLHGMSLKSVPR
jgi:hypothetical protein